MVNPASAPRTNKGPPVHNPKQPDIATTMMAMVTTGNGGHDKLEFREEPVPEIGHGEVLPGGQTTH